MQKKLMVISLLVFLIFFNYNIYEKEKEKKEIDVNGYTVLFKIKDYDTKYIKEGSHIELYYDLGRSFQGSKYTYKKNYDYAVLNINKNNVAKFYRFHRGERLPKNEILFRFGIKDGYINILPRSFFVKKGTRGLYMQARYGIFNIYRDGSSVFIGFADKNYKTIKLKN